MNLLSNAQTEVQQNALDGPLEHAKRKPAKVQLAFALILLAGAAWLPSFPARARDAGPTRGEVAEKKGDLQELRGQIESLRKGVAAAEDQRTGAADQLKDVEQEISRTQRDLHNLSTQRDKLQAALKELGNQSHDLQGRLSSQQAQLERLVYRQYLQGKPDSLRLLLNGDDSSQMARDLYYLAIIGRARSQLLEETESLLQRKQALAADTQQRAAELAAIEDRQKEQHGKLVAQREQRQLVLDKISVSISQQRRAIGNLQRDEKQLSQLIDRLAKAIAAQAEKAAKVERAERAEKAAKAAQAERTAKADKPERPQKSPKSLPRAEAPQKTSAPESERAVPAAPSEISNNSTPEAAPAGDFSRQKGALRLPTRGQVNNRFGSARQEGSTWKGLFIRAAQGSEVKAVAGGRVVFADWMRGFGNLMIVDHGGSYLSVYGNNEALLKQTGDSVRGGDTIASVGNSGGNPESGLYFEIRHQGQPLDPLKWVNLK